MLYKQKKRGKIIIPELFVIEQILKYDNLFFLDNVIDTGITYKTANRLFNGKLKPLVYATTQ